MEWTREARYQRLEDFPVEAYTQLEEQVAQSTYRQHFHVQPKTGLLNDPNGFSYFNGKYHLFYQWFPLGPVHGVKYWYHVSSTDLVHWDDEGIAMHPDTTYDSHGVFSGSGLPVGEELYLFYTGNTRTAEWKRVPYQLIAKMDKNGQIEKKPIPFISDSPKGFTDNFRDPKVFKHGDQYICVIGTETTNHEGKVAYYVSDDLEDWTFKGTINTQLGENRGEVWECPDYFESNGKGILIYSPQGMIPEGDQFQNVFQSGYLLGEPLDFENNQFEHDDFVELDNGFDFYAPQTMLAPDGRHILIGWFGLPGVDTVTETDGWAHCLTLPRELFVKDNHLYQRPIKELETLRKTLTQTSGQLKDNEVVLAPSPRRYEWHIQADMSQAKRFGIKFRMNDEEETIFAFDKTQQTLVFDKTNSGETMTADYGLIRKRHFEAEQLDIRLFLDESSVEIFVNDGYCVFSSRLFSQPDANQIAVFAEGDVTYTSELWEI